ncbi:TonB-dependent receptor [Marixanthomonas spongiae]|uniref:TonB-dependent siderophore receptor n=1 Tax=Marixanthomonas spongiae TaxID=2174845 RepID=A0A2U0I3B7_9FLAO|nr:TonB-dependent receptor [Marixanthomonas spongiae]PVW15588.1 TonB-dependent siderophore receptor [Marixanthomonas spongiae]
MYKLTQLILFLVAVTAANAQTANIEGTVTDANNEPLLGVNVFLNNTQKGAQTDINGHFEISDISEGTYTITFSYVGFKSHEETVTLLNNETEQLPEITLYEGNEILQEVVVNGERRNKFSRKKTAYVSKLPLRDLENSQVYSTITTDLLKSQVTTNFEDALKNATGIEKLWTSTGRGGDGAGYYALRGFSVQPQLVNGVPGITNGTINAANIERIEVIKGPSATLFGSTVTSYGGLINVVTKKPYIGFGGEVSFTSGTYGLNMLSADLNTPLDKDNNIYFRLNTSYSTEDSFQDAGFRKSFFVAPSLSYKVNNRLSFSFYAEITQAEQTNPVFLFLNRSAPSVAKNMDELNYNNKLSFTSNALSLKNPSANYRAEIDYKLSETWQSQTILSKSSTSTDGYYSYLFDYGVFGGNAFTRLINKQNSRTNTTDIQQNFIGDFKLGTLRNRVVAGIDYYNSTVTDNSSGYAFYGNVRPNGQIINDNPFTAEVEEAPLPLTTAGVDAALASQPINNIKSKTHVYSAYVSDVLNITPTFSAMAGVRFDVFDNEGNLTNPDDDYDQSTFSPKFGLLYQPIADVISVFANYQNGFTNVAPALVGDPQQGAQTLKTFDPEQANQLEFGVKTNFFNNRLNATISYYDIKVTDKVITDPTTPFNKIQGGKVESKGFEIEVNANPVRGLNLKGGFSNNDSEITKTDNPILFGTRPNEAGPETLYHLWANYEFQEGALDGFGLGAGFNGASERVTIDYGPGGQFILPAYTIANASVFYQANKYRIGLKLNNVFNKEYYKGWTTITPQTPRALYANFTYKF